MTRITFLVSIFLSFFTAFPGFGSYDDGLNSFHNKTEIPDSLRDRQNLYIGREWKNTFRRITGDPFLFAGYFLPGSVTFNGRTFSNIQIRYDIYSDEIMVPRSLDQIVMLNKEMVDSFLFVYDNKIYRFKKITEDLQRGTEEYVNVLYSGRSALYIKYAKRISTEIADYSDGRFYQVVAIYFVKAGKPIQVRKMKDMYGVLENEKDLMRKYIRENKLKVTRKIPESFLPVVRYYDSLRY